MTSTVLGSDDTIVSSQIDTIDTDPYSRGAYILLREMDDKQNTQGKYMPC